MFSEQRPRLIVDGHFTLSVTVFDIYDPPSAVIVNVAVHVPVEVNGIETVLIPEEVIPVPDAT